MTKDEETKSVASMNIYQKLAKIRKPVQVIQKNKQGFGYKYVTEEIILATLVRKISENYKLPYYTMSPTYSVCKNHGYISGEVYTCPECGEPTEVYSRITGYYRPVQNWNDGKTQEYKDRKVYRVDYDGIKHIEKLSSDEPIETVVKKFDNNISDIILVANPSCPNCETACKELDKAGIKYNKIMAYDNVDYVISLGATRTPTLFAGEEKLKYEGIAEINKFITEYKNLKGD